MLPPYSLCSQGDKFSDLMNFYIFWIYLIFRWCYINVLFDDLQSMLLQDLKKSEINLDRSPVFSIFSKLLFVSPCISFFFTATFVLKSLVVYMWFIFYSMHNIFALPGWRHECILKKDEVSHFGLIFWWRDGKQQCRWEDKKRKEWQNFV